MVYTAHQKVITLKEFGEDRFLTLLRDLKEANHLSDRRNSDWFEHLPNTYREAKFLEWFFLMDGSNFVAFSTIQDYGNWSYRCLTRTYVNRRYRSLFSIRDSRAITVVSHFLPMQLKYLNSPDVGGWRSAFLTRQDPKRRRSFERTLGRCEYWTNRDWAYHPELIKTFEDESSPDAWQNVIYTGEEPDLKTISIERYYELFPDQR
jgi:hypothetical protein